MTMKVLLIVFHAISNPNGWKRP